MTHTAVPRFGVKKLQISVVNLSSTIGFLLGAAKSGGSGYVCVTNGRTAYISNRDDEYLRIQNNSLLTVPDGIPLVWIARNRGFPQVERVSGPDLLEALLRASTDREITHYFFGSDQETLDRMRVKIEGMGAGGKICGMIAPPFQALEEFDIKEIAKTVNQTRPTFFWCGLGAPKQERLIAKLQPLLDNTISIGVGLAFDYFAGNVRRAPGWMQRSGLEGVVRILQQPERINFNLVSRYCFVSRLLVESLLPERKR